MQPHLLEGVAVDDNDFKELPAKEPAWQALDRITADRKRLLAAGYIPVPLNGKIPAHASWQSPNPPNKVEIQSWTRDCETAVNTGILTRLTPAIDIDVLDGPVANKIMDLAAAIVGESTPFLVRFGRHPKRAVLFRTDVPFKKKRTADFVSPDGLKHHVEILCDGQQLAAFGLHPETGKPYHWPQGAPGEVKHSELPMLTEAIALQFIADATDIMLAAGWRREKPKPTNGAARAAPAINTGLRERHYAQAALDGCADELAGTAEGGRNDALNAKAFRLGTMVARGWIARGEATAELLNAARACGLHEMEARQTCKSGLDAGEKQPYPDLLDRDMNGEARRNSSTTSDIDDEDFETVEIKNSEQLKQSRKLETGTWEEPDFTLLDDRRGELPEFPVGALPASLHDWLHRAAHGAGVTVDHVAVPLLGIASSLIGTARRIKASRSWSEPMTCWAGVIGFSGTGKTPGIDVTKRALAQVERDSRSKVAELRRAHQTRVERFKAEQKKWKAEVEAAVEAGSPPPQMPVSAVDPGKFVAPRLHVSTGTIERFAELLLARPQGVLRLSDELSGLFLNMSRYSNGQDNEFWLEAWNGNPYTVENMGRQLAVDHLLIGVVGGLQPDKVAKSFSGDLDGMYARFLFAWPREPGFQELTDEVAEVEPEIVNALTRINNLPEKTEEGALVVRSIELSGPARDEFEQFRQFLHLGKEQLDGREREWWAKGGAHVLRLAGTLAYLNWAFAGGPEPSLIEAEFVQAAIQLVRDYFWPHSRAALRQIGLSDRHANARRALRWMRTNKKEQISVQDIRRDALAQGLDEKGTRDLIDVMVRAGWLREAAIETGKGPGRHAHRWEVNPLLYGGAGIAENAEIGAAR
jgi:hypothetical protein